MLLLLPLPYLSVMSSSLDPRSAYIVAYSRTPFGLFLGQPQGKYSATELCAHSIRATMERAQARVTAVVDGSSPAIVVDEVILGNVVGGGVGMAPARQAAVLAGLSPSTPCTTVNKVCASGMKAIELAAQSIACGTSEAVLCGGMESMSRVPHYALAARTGHKYGDISLVDGLLHDGLTWNGTHMGNFTERCAEKYGLSRQAQDDYAVETYKRALAADFSEEIVPLDGADKDAEPARFQEAKLRALKPAFESQGTITAGNASTLSDGAATLVVMSGDACNRLGVRPVARLVAFGNAEQEPEWFTTAPSLAIPKALARANLPISDIDLFEINEAYAAVALANMKILGLTSEKVNVLGGAVAIGHPLGASGARIVETLITALRQRGGRLGCAGICNGGGGASACVLEIMP